MIDLYFTSRESEHWDAMWAWLAAHPYNAGLERPTVAECPETGEAWQYMGTERDENGRWHDCFRHRHHPTHRRRVYLRRPSQPRLHPVVEARD